MKIQRQTIRYYHIELQQFMIESTLCIQMNVSGGGGGCAGAVTATVAARGKMRFRFVGNCLSNGR